MRRQISRTVLGLSVVAAAVLAVVGLGYAPARDALASTYPRPLAVTGDVRAIVNAAPRPSHDEDLPTAVIVLAS
jgi:hypothetical protein